MKSRIAAQGPLSELFYKPKHIHSFNRRFAASTNRSITTRVTPTLPSILNKNSKMGRTNDPVLLQSSTSVAENHLNNIHTHLTNGNQKWASSLAAQQKINGDTPQKTPSSTISSTTQPSSILQDQAALMGIL